MTRQQHAIHAELRDLYGYAIGIPLPGDTARLMAGFHPTEGRGSDWIIVPSEATHIGECDLASDVQAGYADAYVNGEA